MFAYDATANLLEGPQHGGLVVHNKLLVHQDKRYRYDSFGRMVEKRSARYGVQHFRYDAEHRLVEVRCQDSTNHKVVRMVYHPLGRQIEKTQKNSAGYPLSTVRFTWDGPQLIQEHSNNQTSLYLYSDGGYELLARIDSRGLHHNTFRFYDPDIGRCISPDPIGLACKTRAAKSITRHLRSIAKKARISQFQSKCGK